MAHSLNGAGFSAARRLIADGKIDRTRPWSFSAADGNKLLGENRDNFRRFAAMHLGRDTTQADPNTKDAWRFPFGKLVGDQPTVFRSAVIAIRQRANQVGAPRLFEAAGQLLNLIDRRERNSRKWWPDLLTRVEGKL